MSAEAPSFPPATAPRRRFRDPVNGFLHLGGLILAIFGTCFLLARCQADASHLVGAAIYGLGLCGCFLGSSLHHLVSGSRPLEMRLLKLDHAAIYSFIAGTYTPICLWLLPSPNGMVLLSAVWAIAGIGIVYKMAFAKDPDDVNAPPGLADTLVYVLMGWLAVTEVSHLVARAAPGTIALLVTSGLAYTVGGIILTRRWFDFWPGRFGHHEIWHVFVLAGTAAAYAFIWLNAVP